MAMNIAQVHTHKKYPFRYAQMQGCANPDADHASAWTFDDEQEFRDRWWHQKKGDVVLDIGAAFGSYALPSLAMGARVIAFSPADFDTELLKINLGLNPELAERCVIVRDGIYSQDGWFDPDHSQFAKQPVRDQSEHSTDSWLRVRSLDSFLAERPGIDRVDWIKMDIEGAEFEALKGAEQCLRRWKPKMLIELHEQHVPDMIAKVCGFIAHLGLGYSCDGPFKHGVVSRAFFEAR